MVSHEYTNVRTPQTAHFKWMQLLKNYTSIKVIFKNLCVSFTPDLAALLFFQASKCFVLANVKWMAGGKQPHSTGRSARGFVTTYRGGIGRVGGRCKREGI